MNGKTRINMALASIRKINSIEVHPNADKLEIARVGGWKCIVQKGMYQEGELICFIESDTVLPVKPWTEFYRAKSSRVKSCRLRSIWSEGVVEKLDKVEYTGPIEEGKDISVDIGVVKWEPPVPSDLQARGVLPFGIQRTDECRIENLDTPPFGEMCDINLKVDGSSASFYCHKFNGKWQTGICSRSLELKLDCINKFTTAEKKYDVLNKLKDYCVKNDVSICLRGELYGQGIQTMSVNPHCRAQGVNLAFFSVYLINERRYARTEDDLYFYKLCSLLELPTVPILEKCVKFTPEIITKYQEMKDLNGVQFEGVVVNTAKDSFKIINKTYDSLK